MDLLTDIINVKTEGNTDILNITPEIEKVFAKANITEGIMHLFVIGSTAGLTTIEYEPGLVEDLRNYFKRTAPEDIDYKHHERWHDNNGHSHIRATIVKQSFSLPIFNKKIILGTWQQVILVDFDTRPRSREIVVQIFGKTV